MKSHHRGTLYVVSTPIGNLEDITLRALRILREADLIAAENVTHTRGLCRHYQIRTKLTSYNQHNQRRKAPELVEKLKAGKDIALVSDAGTPGISDPGVYLVHLSAEAGIRVTPIPGPSAATAALSVTGMRSEQFVFVGFLPNRPARRKKALKRLAQETATLVFFEAPHRLLTMLVDMKGVLGDRNMVMIREMTKLFEEVYRGRISSILDQLTPEKIRGEFTLVVKGVSAVGSEPIPEEISDRIARLVSERKGSLKDIASRLAEEEGLAYRQIYKACLAAKRQREGSKCERAC